MPEYRGAWFFAQMAMRRRAGMSAARVVHVTDPNALCALRGRRLLTTAYDLIPLKQGISRRSVLNRLGYSAYLHALRHADVLFAISQQTADDLVEMLHVPRGRIVVAQPGIDLPPAGELRQGGRPYFLFLGGPNPNKNLAVVLEAMAHSRDLKEELLVAGHWLPGQLAALQEELRGRGLSDRVRHVGFIPDQDIVPLMRGATALLVPSLSEGYGLPVGEGLAAGGVVIHSDIPVLEEVSGGAGLAFDPHSPDQLASCLRRIASDPALADDLRRRGRERAKALTWDAAVQATLDAYRKVLSR
jgi:glycosyltransferase involved in cell wall biosynthesis